MFTCSGKKRIPMISISLLFFSIGLYGCAGIKDFTFQEDLPTIAHVHIGHAVTAWMHSPEKKGLFVVAEEEGQIALAEAKRALEKPEDIENIKKHVRGVIHVFDPDIIDKGPGLGFGLMNALEESYGHINYASRSDDATVNVQQFAEVFEQQTLSVLERCDLVLALGQEILALSSAEDSFVLASEIYCYIASIVDGPDVPNECSNSGSTNEIGLKQLRDQIDEMIAREVPEYKTIATRYLFGVIKLPSGKWTFSWLVNPFYDDEDIHGGNGDGGGGGY